MLQNLFARLFKKSAPHEKELRKPLIHLDGTILDRPVSFGYKCNWFAVHTTDTEKLATVFHLIDATPCNWEYGIHYAYEGRVFVSPPVDGWTFVVSRNLPYAEDEQRILLLKTMLIDLSTEFAQAQYFGTLRTAGYDCWIKAENGHILRAYALADGANTIVEGEPTLFEKKYNLYNTLSEEYANDPNYGEGQGVDYPDESMTMEVAGAWSINPQDLQERDDLAPRLGFLGLCDWH